MVGVGVPLTCNIQGKHRGHTQVYCDPPIIFDLMISFRCTIKYKMAILKGIMTLLIPDADQEILWLYLAGRYFVDAIGR